MDLPERRVGPEANRYEALHDLCLMQGTACRRQGADDCHAPDVLNPKAALMNGVAVDGQTGEGGEFLDGILGQAGGRTHLIERNPPALSIAHQPREGSCQRSHIGIGPWAICAAALEWMTHRQDRIEEVLEFVGGVVREQPEQSQ